VEVNCDERYRRLAQYCAEREGELARYKRLAYEYSEELKRLTMLLSAAVSYLNNLVKITGYSNENLNAVLNNLNEEVRYYLSKYVVTKEEQGQ